MDHVELSRNNQQISVIDVDCEGDVGPGDHILEFLVLNCDVLLA